MDKNIFSKLKLTNLTNNVLFNMFQNSKYYPKLINYNGMYQILALYFLPKLGLSMKIVAIIILFL
jgi:hypothetical protein